MKVLESVQRLADTDPPIELDQTCIDVMVREAQAVAEALRHHAECTDLTLHPADLDLSGYELGDAGVSASARPKLN